MTSFYNSADCFMVKDIQILVCDYFKVSLKDLKSDRHDRRTARARHYAMYLARTLTRHSYPVIGRLFGRDHTSVIYAIQKMEGDISKDTMVKEHCERLAYLFKCRQENGQEQQL